MKKLLSIVLALAMLLTLVVMPTGAIESTYVAYYVGDATDGDAVEATVGETYKPDRMPITAAPEGQYFVGWASEDGKIYADGFTLAEGENKLTAVYANYPVETKVNVTGQNYFNNNRAYLPSYVEGKDPAYYPYIVPVTSGAVNYKYIAATEDQPAYMHWSNGQYGGDKSMIFTDENGNVIQGKWNTKYRITFKYRIPANEAIKKDTENEPAAVGIHFMMGFGAKVDMRDTFYTNPDVSGALGANWMFASMVDKGGVEFASCWDDWGFFKHGLGTLSWNGDTDTSSSPITGDEWETMVYEITTPAADAAYFPVFTFNIRMAGWDGYKSLNQQMDIAEITITDTSKAEVQYVVNGEDEDTISGLTPGAVYTPDRMPTAATPAGKYFAGWKLNDKFVVDTVTLSYGINKLEAVYKDCVTGTVEADLLAANLPAKNGTTDKKVLLPMIYNGAYRGYVAMGGWAGSKDGSDASGTFVNHYNGDPWVANTLKILHDSEGAALIAKPSTTYKIALTYRLTKYPETFTYSYADWKESGENTSLRTGWSTYFMVGYNPTVTSPDDFQNLNGQAGTYGKAVPQEHATWYDEGDGLGFWKDVAGDGEWHTEVFQITTHSAEKYAADGYLPVFSYCYNGPHMDYAADFKSIVITEVAGTVNYYVGKEIEKSVGGLNIGSAFTPDYVPAATPEGTTFGGWKDAEGNLVETLTVVEGDNNLYAYFKEAPTVAYYVNGVQEGETIIGLTEGATYAPDRKPTAAAPEGKYFAGWMYNGEFVVDCITVTAGANRLEAVYKDYATGTVNATLPITSLPKDANDAPKVLVPTVVDGVYQGYTALNGYGTVEDKNENGEHYLHYTSWGDWSNPTLQLVHDEDGVAYMAKPDTTYVIEFTYRASFADAYKLNYSDWKNNVGSRTDFMMYFNVGFLPEYSRKDYQNADGCLGGDQYKATPQQHATWYDNGNGLGFWQDVCGNGWVTETFKVTTLSAAKYEEVGMLPLFNYYIGTNHTKNQVDVKSIVIKEVSVHDDFATANINGFENASYVKLLDEVEDNTTYKIVLEGQSANSQWSDVGFMTAAADNVNANQSFMYRNATPFSASYGYEWWVTNTVYVTTDLAAEGDALYLYVSRRENLRYLNVISIEKVEAVSNGGVSILKDQPANATQAMRYYFDYNTTTGSDIVIDGKTYNVASRGFLLADADKLGDAVVTRQTAKAENSGIFDMNTTDLTKCWEVTETGTGVETITFSTYITGFKAVNGTYNNTNKLYVKAYVVLEDGTILYAKESAETVSSVAIKVENALPGGRVH